ncbi:Protein of unknown function (DUF3592) [Rubrobacter radiotolerans]|uniref:DUF3592 domain-containing protein n=1 Tax=Rubrobacter radiotolerans TaxID=42256 RepID=A0A023X644_RUBRA|nr:DUF3592 domain-containing protein [Rubrobacter radiotolerans]AHY47937.1 Protein of unknown function (DUF3592) [Rubrobacter radiotolerans]MDX5892576.1 DUF3592 domain-containing protein [Rubrobacter radiotolerans]SMC07865.1 Protein of unknown function [Rubrobacter radiotolerans DSM 5868]
MNTATAERGQLSTTGIVTGHVQRTRRSFERPGTLIHPVVEFVPQSGRPVRFESPLGSNVPPRIGERVTVFYDPERPLETAEVPPGDVLRLGKWHLLVVATIFLVPAALFALLVLSVIAISLL